MNTLERKTRIAVPYTERMYALPNSGFATLVEALWGSTHDDCEVVKLHESELPARDDYDAILLIRCGWFDTDILEGCLAGAKPVAYWADDLHWFWRHIPYPPRKLISMFERVDLVFVTYFQQFLQWRVYRQFVDKVVWSPWSVPDSVFECSMPWQDRRDRVLLSGVSSVQYPLRRWLFQYAQENNGCCVDVLHHPGYMSTRAAHGITGRDFHRLLGSYKGAIATTASTRIRLRRTIDYTVAKYFEIPACGCVPFMEVTPDLGELGFVDGLNYVSITRWNCEKKIAFVHSREAEGVGRAAQELVRSRHTHSHRVRFILDGIVHQLVKRHRNHGAPETAGLTPH